jgi:ABC-type multidrug transport system fused ATPase/permease subunit
VRANLDPFNTKTDAELWDVLTRIHMRRTVESLRDGLSHHVEEDGANFSLGERQLLCLGRAMARRSRIVIFDEASASLDFETDQLIRQFVETEFKDATVITIAHRLRTHLLFDLPGCLHPCSLTVLALSCPLSLAVCCCAQTR